MRTSSPSEASHDSQPQRLSNQVTWGRKWGQGGWWVLHIKHSFTSKWILTFNYVLRLPPPPVHMYLFRCRGRRAASSAGRGILKMRREMEIRSYFVFQSEL